MTRRSVTDPVASLLAGAVATVAPSATLTAAARALTREHLGLLLVVDRDGVAGVLSERDIVAAAADDAQLGIERVIDHANLDIVTIDEDEPIARAAALMAAAEVRHLAVARAEQIIGVVSVRDVVAVLAADHDQPAVAPA